MSDLETRLTDALHADTPPTRDPLFRVELLVRLERARFRRRVGRALVVVGVLAVLAALNVRVIDNWLAADNTRVWVAALAAVATLWALSLVLITPRFRIVARAVGRLLYP
ncbi:MAG: hypothetical protein ACRD3G_26840 [Vicinamibacterales bacterium]